MLDGIQLVIHLIMGVFGDQEGYIRRLPPLDNFAPVLSRRAFGELVELLPAC